MYMQLDCTTNQKTCKRYGVDGVPTLLLFEAGLVVKRYTGPLTLQDLVVFVTDNSEGSDGQTEKANKVCEMEI